MNRRRSLLAALGLSAAAGRLPAQAQPQRRIGELTPLGHDRFQLGRVLIDKPRASFSVPGRVHALGRPLEYLATSPGGFKEYESLFELDAIGSEFNFACILVGLEPDPNQKDWSHNVSLVGRRVAISVAWTQDGRRHQVPAAEALLNPDSGLEPGKVQWVYTGSGFGDSGGRYAADNTGTLVGFIHDPNCVIDSAAVLGVGAYGSIRGHPMLPPNGSPMELIVDAAILAK